MISKFHCLRLKKEADKDAQYIVTSTIHQQQLQINQHGLGHSIVLQLYISEIYRSMFAPFLMILLICFSIAEGMRLANPQRQGYHTDSEIEEIVNALTAINDPFVKKTCIQAPQYNYIEIGKPGPEKLNAVILCNIHAREIATAEMCLHWLQNLHPKQLPISRYFTRVFYIANHNRQAFIDNETSCLRKNQNNVDVNRNFPTDFNHWNATQSNQTYGGKEPFDQPLSKCLNRLFTQNLPYLYVDLHSGMNGVAFYQQGVNNQHEMEIFEGLNKQICESKLRLTTLAKEGETINGHIFADIKVRLKVPYSYLFETYNSPNPDCFFLFNPVGQAKTQLISRYSSVLDFLFTKVDQFSSL